MTTSGSEIECDVVRSPLPFPCVPDRPYKILLVQVGTLSFSHPSFGVSVVFIAPRYSSTQSHSCDVAGGHNYVYENISSPARCELAAPGAPFPASRVSSPERPNLFGREPVSYTHLTLPTKA